MIIANDEQGQPMMDIRLESWESPGVRKVMPVMGEGDTKGYIHEGFCVNQEGVGLTGGKIMEKAMQMDEKTQRQPTYECTLNLCDQCKVSYSCHSESILYVFVHLR
jgi:hypothetical protein